MCVCVCVCVCVFVRERERESEREKERDRQRNNKLLQQNLSSKFVKGQCYLQNCNAVVDSIFRRGMCKNIFCVFILFLFFGNTRVWTEGLMLATTRDIPPQPLFLLQLFFREGLRLFAWTTCDCEASTYISLFFFQISVMHRLLFQGLGYWTISSLFPVHIGHRF
jgi:hypothetical protein